MPITRRHFLHAAAISTAGRLARSRNLDQLKIGVTDWNLKQAAELAAVPLAKSLGFAGVQISLGRNAVAGHLKLADPALQDSYLASAREQGIALDGTCLDILHVNYLKNDPLGQRWVADSIPITKRLGAQVILLPFFGKGAIQQRAEQDYVADAL